MREREEEKIIYFVLFSIKAATVCAVRVYKRRYFIKFDWLIYLKLNFFPYQFKKKRAVRFIFPVNVYILRNSIRKDQMVDFEANCGIFFFACLKMPKSVIQ